MKGWKNNVWKILWFHVFEGYSNKVYLLFPITFHFLMFKKPFDDTHIHMVVLFFLLVQKKSFFSSIFLLILKPCYYKYIFGNAFLKVFFSYNVTTKEKKKPCSFHYTYLIVVLECGLSFGQPGLMATLWRCAQPCADMPTLFRGISVIFWKTQSLFYMPLQQLRFIGQECMEWGQ